MLDKIEIIPYSSTYKEAIKLLNVEWLEKYFFVEPNDVISLSNPEEEILNKGGFIYYAKLNNQIVGTASLLKVNNTIFELSKMAVTETAKGKGIGKLLMEHCIHEAKIKNIKTLILFSNTKLTPAITLYKKFGFKEIPLETGKYLRANIKMQLDLN